MCARERQEDRHKRSHSSIIYRRLSESNMQNEKNNNSPKIVVKIKHHLYEALSSLLAPGMYLVDGSHCLLLFRGCINQVFSCKTKNTKIYSDSLKQK